MSFDIGDIVEVKSIEEIKLLGKERFDGSIVLREHCAPILFDNVMMRYCGERGEICCITYSQSGICFYTVNIRGYKISLVGSVLKHAEISIYWDEPRSNFDDSLICDWLSGF